MRYNRESAFRYTFEEPIDALFEINQIDGDAVHSHNGEAKINDLSPEGVQLHTAFDLPDDKSIHLTISFVLNGNEFHVDGLIVWKKKRGHTSDYGMELHTDDTAKKDIVEQLKIYSKKAITGS